MTSTKTTGLSRSPLPLLLISAGVLLGANGMMMTLIAVRAGGLGFSDSVIGLLGTAYFAGFVGGSICAAYLIRQAGHIRVFSAFAAMGAIAALALLLSEDPIVWGVSRFAAGMVFSTSAMVMESWLNVTATSKNRGQILSAYRIVDLSFVTGFQFLVPALGPLSVDIIVIAAILFCVALLPVALSRLESPTAPPSAKIRPSVIWQISPVAVVGCITIGLTNGAFRTVGPVYAEELGMGTDQIALFMSLGIAAGALLQYPLGWLSDRVSRRVVLLLATIGAMVGSALLTALGAEWAYVAIMVFGGFALPLYALSAAHANDFATRDQVVELAAGLTLSFALGASIGPLVVSLLMESYGAKAFFLYTAVLHGCFLLFVLYRLTRRAGVDEADKTSFVGLMRTSSVLVRMARRHSEDKGQNAGERETG